MSSNAYIYTKSNTLWLNKVLNSRAKREISETFLNQNSNSRLWMYVLRFIQMLVTPIATIRNTRKKHQHQHQFTIIFLP